MTLLLRSISIYTMDCGHEVYTDDVTSEIYFYIHNGLWT